MAAFGGSRPFDAEAGNLPTWIVRLDLHQGVRPFVGHFSIVKPRYFDLIINGLAIAWTQPVLKRTHKIFGSTLGNYIASDSLTRGAAIAFYSVTSLVPVLVIVIAIAGLAFGEDAARGAIVRELAELIGSDSAKLIQRAIESAYNTGSNSFALIVGAIVLALTVSGVFGELQSALNAIWRVHYRAFSISRLLRGRAASIGLVIGLGFLLLVSLVIDASVRATSDYIDQYFRYGAVFLAALNTVASFALTWTFLRRFTKCYQINPWIGRMSFLARW